MVRPPLETPRILLLVATILVTVALVAPSAAAHAATEPLEVETHVIQDEGEDLFYWVDGYDLYNVLVREAYWEPLDRSGIILRFDLYGGSAPASTHDAMHIEVTSDDAPGPLRITTTDDRNWTGDLTVVYQETTKDSAPWTGYTHLLQVFAPYEALGLEPGGELTGLTLRSYAGGDLVDVAPGGFAPPGSPTMAPSDSQRLVDAVPLEGPHGYVNVSLEAQGSLVNVTVENPLATGQHVRIAQPAIAGWNATFRGASQVSLDAGKNHTFTLDVTATSAAASPLPLEVHTDLGGRTTHYVGVSGDELVPASTEESAPVKVQAAEPAETPVPAWLALGAVGAALVLLRRHRV